ncbi:ShK domain-containing protein [Aphelenchoides fujianensis]|nr:ShK domain-containing protein [Aphelenchoides fujianensis]
MKTMIVDHCQMHSVHVDCGPSAGCSLLPTGNRCECPHGRMGIKCRTSELKDPAKTSTARAASGKRKDAASGRLEFRLSSATIAPIRAENARVMDEVRSFNRLHLTPLCFVLEHPLPPSLEPLAWLVGRWTAEVCARVRFPSPMADRRGYAEVLDVRMAAVNMFDRPALNVSIVAKSLDGREERNDLGFVTMKSAVEFERADGGNGNQSRIVDRLAIGLVGNTGIGTIEEGEVVGGTAELRLVRLLSMRGGNLVETKRRFKRIDAQTLEERVVLVGANGKRAKFTKRFRLVDDHLANWVPVRFPE